MYYPFVYFIRKKIVLYAGEEKKITPLVVQTVDLFINGKRMLVEPNDTIEFSINYSEVVLQNPDKTYSSYPSYYKNNFYNRFESPLKKLANRSTDVNEYKEYCYSYMLKERKFIDSFFKDGKPLLKNYLYQKSGFDFIWFFSKIFEREDFILKDSLFISSQAEQLLINNTPIFFDYSYRNALFDYVELIAGEKQSALSSSKLGHIIMTGEKVLPQAVYKQLLLNTLDIISRVSSSEYDYVTRYIYKKLREISFSSLERETLKRMYNKTLVASKSLKYFYETDIEGFHEKKTKLKNILLKDKIYLFDFWASWCPPCIAEIPYLKKISLEYPEVQIISISKDEDKSKWKKAVQKYGLSPENNFIVTTLKGNKFLDHYQIKDIPRFLMFNSKGECITSNAPRPSERQFYDYLKQLLSVD